MSDAIATTSSEIYLDANATTPILPAAQAAMIRVLSDNFGNPGSPHGAGIRARIELDRARTAVAAVLQLPANSLIFTSGATEGIQTAVLSVLHPQRGAASLRVLYGATEHKAVPEALAHWGEILGLTLELLPIPVDQHGRHDLSWLAENAKDATLVCTMAANNETGAISDLAGIARVLDALPVRPLWLVDGVQALGKLAVDWLGLRIDYAPFSGHKLHAPKGIGLLYVRAGAPFTRLLAGGGQEGNARCGTENLPGIAALGAVCEAILAGQWQADALALAHQRLKTALLHAFPSLVMNSPSQHSLPTTINFSLLGIPSKCLLDLFDSLGLRLSAGSACNSKNAKPSFVLMAMGLGEARASSAIRLSISPNVCAADIDAAIERIALAGQILQTHLNDMLQLEQVALPDENLELSSRYAVTAEQLPAWQAVYPKGVLVDIREHWEQIATGAYPVGMMIEHHSLSQLPRWLGCLALDRPLLLACRSGRRSGQLLSLMRAKGYTQIWHLADGLAGLPMPSAVEQ